MAKKKETIEGFVPQGGVSTDFDYSVITDLEQDAVSHRKEAQTAQENIQKANVQIEQVKAQIEQLVGAVNYHNGYAASNQVTAERILTKAGKTFEDYLAFKEATKVEDPDVTTSSEVN
jgi:hypothetical protein